MAGMIKRHADDGRRRPGLVSWLRQHAIQRSRAARASQQLVGHHHAARPDVPSPAEIADGIQRIVEFRRRTGKNFINSIVWGMLLFAGMIGAAERWATAPNQHNVPLRAGLVIPVSAEAAMTAATALLGIVVAINVAQVVAVRSDDLRRDAEVVARGDMVPLMGQGLSAVALALGLAPWTSLHLRETWASAVATTCIGLAAVSIGAAVRPWQNDALLHALQDQKAHQQLDRLKGAIAPYEAIPSVAHLADLVRPQRIRRYLAWVVVAGLASSLPMLVGALLTSRHHWSWLTSGRIAVAMIATIALCATFAGLVFGLVGCYRSAKATRDRVGQFFYAFFLGLLLLVNGSAELQDLAAETSTSVKVLSEIWLGMVVLLPLAFAWQYRRGASKRGPAKIIDAGVLVSLRQDRDRLDRRIASSITGRLAQGNHSAVAWDLWDLGRRGGLIFGG